MSNENLLSAEVEVEVDGETVTHTLYFKPLTLVPMGILRKTRNDQSEQMWQVLEWALPPESLAICDDLPTKELEDVLNRLQQTSEADLGKSSGSSKSSTGTGARSKRT